MANSTSRKPARKPAARQQRPVAILGGNRIPFARQDKAYATASNQDMFTAALSGLVSRFNLQGEQLGMVAGGAVLKHSRDFNLIRESVLGSALSPYTPGLDVQQALQMLYSNLDHTDPARVTDAEAAAFFAAVGGDDED